MIFGQGGSVVPSFANPVIEISDSSRFDGPVTECFVYDDGSLLIVGGFNSYNGIIRKGIIKLLPNGELDNTFNYISGFQGGVLGLEPHPDGGFILFGGFTTYNGQPVNGLIWIDEMGNQNSSLNIGSGFYYNGATAAQVYAAAVQNDGKILVAGNFFSYQGNACDRFFRLNADGSVDESFIVQNYLPAMLDIFVIKIQDDNKILIGGNISAYGTNSNDGVVRIMPDGTEDNSFILPNLTAYLVKAIEITNDGNILIGGGILGQNSHCLEKVDFSGNVITSFSDGLGFEFSSSAPSVRCIYEDTDGSLLVGGYFKSYDGYPAVNIVKLQSSGEIDLTFNNAENATGLSTGPFFLGTEPLHITKAQNGNYYLSIPPNINNPGTVSRYNNVIRNGFAEITPLGELTTNFSTYYSFDAVGNFDYSVKIIESFEDYFLIGGSYSSFDGYVLTGIIKLDEDGNMDPNFNHVPFNSGITTFFSAIDVFPDSSIIVSGNFTQYDESPRNYLVKLDPNGYVDESFNVGQSSPSIKDVAVQAVNKVIVIGSFTTFEGQPLGGIVRLNANGSIDNTFQSGTGFAGSGSSPANVVTVQSDQKILLGGNFYSYNGVNVSRIIRLNEDGSLDETFNAPSDFPLGISEIVELPDGKILVGYRSVSTSYPGISRLNSDGSIDSTFQLNPMIDAGDYVFDIVQQPTGEVIAVGDFTSLTGTTASHILRAQNNGAIDQAFLEEGGFNDNANSLALHSDGGVVVVGDFSEYSAWTSYGIIKLDGTSNSTQNINQIKSNNEIYAYPNPSSSTVSIKIPSELINKTFTIIDESGRKIKIGQANSPIIEIEHLIPGIYLFSILNSDFLVHLVFN